MKKESTLYIILAIALISAIFSFIYIITFEPKEILLSPIDFLLNFPADCSDSSIKVLWDSIYKISSDSIITFVNFSSPNYCNKYLAIKTINNSFYILEGYKIIENQTNEIKILVGHYGNGTAEYLAILQNITSAINNTNFVPYTNPPISPSYLFTRNTTINEMNELFTNTFKITTLNWQIDNEEPALYEFTELNFTSNETTTKNTSLSGGISANYTINFILFTESSKYASLCQSNWTAVNTSCTIEDKKTTWFNDINSCPNAQPPENKSIDCDYDNNKIIGNESYVKEINLNAEIYIGSSLLNYSTRYDQTKKIEIKDNTTTIIEFDYNFNYSELNLKNIYIEKQPSGSKFGYLIVEGINATKKFVIDKINSSSTKICVRSKAVTSISDLSSDCSSSAETKLDCPESFGELSCNILNNKFEVSGLTNSAVKEILPSPQTSVTTTNNQNTQTNAANNASPSQNIEPPVPSQNQNEQTTQATPVEPKESKSEQPLTWIIAIISLIASIITISSIIIYLMVKSSPKKKDSLPGTIYTYNPQKPRQFTED